MNILFVCDTYPWELQGGNCQRTHLFYESLCRITRGVIRLVLRRILSHCEGVWLSNAGQRCVGSPRNVSAGPASNMALRT